MLSSRPNLPVFRQIQDIEGYCLHISFHPLSFFFLYACMYVLRQKFAYFFFEKTSEISRYFLQLYRNN